MPIEIPAGVTVSQNENTLTVKGAKGELTRTFHPDINIAVEENVITVTRPSDGKEHRSLHGLTRALVANMVTGVHEGFTKTLEINGVGYRAAKQGNKLALTLGFSHPVEMEAPAGITIDVPAPNKIVVSGADKEVVGAVALIFVNGENQNLTKVKVSVTKAKLFVVKQVKLALKVSNNSLH